MKRGEIRWYTFRIPDKRRPVLILTRDEVIDRLNEVIVVPVTRTIRGLTTEVANGSGWDAGYLRAEFRSRVARTTRARWQSHLRFSGGSMA